VEFSEAVLISLSYRSRSCFR